MFATMYMDQVQLLLCHIIHSLSHQKHSNLTLINALIPKIINK